MRTLEKEELMNVQGGFFSWIVGIAAVALICFIAAKADEAKKKGTIKPTDPRSFPN